MSRFPKPWQTILGRQPRWFAEGIGYGQEALIFEIGDGNQGAGADAVE